MRIQQIVLFPVFICLLISCQPTNEQLLNKANQFSRDSNFDKAIEIYTSVIKSNDQLPLAWYERGLAYQATRKYTLAMADYNKVLALKPSDIPYVDDALFQRAQVKFYVDSLESAYADLALLIDKSYKKASCLLWQGAIYVKKGEKAAACPFFIKAKELAATPIEIQQSNEAASVYCGK
jgi:tetratricopeptide (TPR) repeat protein